MTEPTDRSQPEVGTAVERAFAQVEAARAVAEEALAAAEHTAGTDLVPRGADAVAVKAQAADLYAKSTRARAELARAQQAAMDAVRAQQQALEAQLAEQMALLKPLEQQVAQAQEVIWTVNLYLGRDETIVRLTDGEPAPADTPLVIRQQVLAMDEETGAHAATGGSDVSNIDEFDAWITGDPAHLNQVLPEPRGVVAIIARRTEKDYGDPWLTSAMNEANHETWWLIRNGDNLYRMITDLNVGKRLVPLRDEFTAMFTDRLTGQPLAPGSDAWIKAEQAAGARQRHFMRVALILQGMLDRSTVFHPLPTPPLSLLASPDYDTGRVVLRTDDEMQLTTGRTPFYDWLAAKNSMLTPGMRIIINTRHQDWPARGRDRHNYGQHERLSPPRAESPPSGVVHTITRRGNKPGSLVFTYERTSETWVRGDYGYESRAPKTRASATIFPADKFVLPIDLVTVAEMREYLEARTERHAYADMFPTLRAAIEVKEAEAAQEAPFRSMLAAQIAQAENIDLDEATGFVDEMVHWWKTGNRWHRALSGDQEAEAKATKAILTERARRARAVGDTDRDSELVARIRRDHPDVLLIARRKNGAYVALTPQPRRWARPTDTDYGDQVAPLNVWVTQHDYTPTGTPKPVTEWVLPAPAQVSRWIVLHEGAAWATWNKGARRSEHLTDPEIEDLLEQFQEQSPYQDHRLLAVAYRESAREWGAPREFILYYHPPTVPQCPDNYLTEPFEVLHSPTRNVRCDRDRDGTITTRADTRLHTSNITNWDVSHNTLTDGATVGVIRPPWTSDRRGNFIIWTDEQALADAQAQADEWNQQRARIARARNEVRRLTDGIEQAWTERAYAEAKARFIEDYGDESLWPAHEETLTLIAPWSHRARQDKAYKGTGAGLAHLVSRLMETGRPPYGLTVGDALVVLAESLHEPEAFTHRVSRGGREVSLHADVLDLRFPEARLAIEEATA